MYDTETRVKTSVSAPKVKIIVIECFLLKDLPCGGLESYLSLAVLRIRDMLVRIRIRGSVPLTYGSGFGSDSGSDPGSCYFSVGTFKMATKNEFFQIFLLLTF